MNITPWGGGGGGDCPTEMTGVIIVLFKGAKFVDSFSTALSAKSKMTLELASMDHGAI